MAETDHDVTSPAPAGAPSLDFKSESIVRALHWTGAVVLVVAVCLVYGPQISAPLVFDDYHSILFNPSIRRLWPLFGPSGAAPLNPLWDSPVAGRPLVNLTLAINYAVSGTNLGSYRLFNIVLHVLSALVLWAIVRRLLRLDYFQGRFDRAAEPLAYAAALVWALHPLQTEAIEYVTQRTELMLGLFYLLTLYCSLRYFTASDPRRRNRWCWSAVAASCLGMTCKESMVTAPVIILLFDRTFVSGTFRAALRTSWPLYAGLAASWLLLLALNYAGPRSHSAGFGLGLPLIPYWAAEVRVLLMYLKLCVWPWPLVINYYFPLNESLSSNLLWLSGAAALGIATLVLVWRRRALGFVAAWVLIIVSPTLVVPILREMAAERRLYLPLAAIVVFFVAGGYLLLRWVAQRIGAGSGRASWWPVAAICGASLLVAIGFAALSARRLEAYETSLALWQDAYRHQPENVAVLANFVYALVNAGRSQEALPYIQRALELDPDSPEANKFLGVTLRNAGNTQKAIVYLQKAVAEAPRDGEARGHLAHALLNAGRLPEALKEFEKAFEIAPGNVLAYAPYARALMQAGRPESLEYFQKALQADPGSTETLMNYGVALMAAGRAGDAVAVFKKLERSQPNSVGLHINFAKALFSLRRYEEAMRHFEIAAQSEPDSVILQENLGVIKLKLGRTREAVDHLRRAVNLKPADAELHAKLGVALYRHNELDEAARELELALELDPDVPTAQAGLEEVRKVKALLESN